jgi:hypothetical protein
MAKIMFGALATDVRGKIAGIVYSKNQFGGYVRQKVSPTQAPSARRTLVRERLTGLAKAWRNDLTPAQVAAWNSFAKANPVTDVFGRAQNTSGIQKYVTQNANIINAGGTRIDDPPASLFINNLTDLTVVATSGGTVTLPVVSGETTTDTFTVSGHHASQLPNGTVLTAVGVTGNAGPFTVVAAVDTGANTVIAVAENVVNVGAAGHFTAPNVELLELTMTPDPFDATVVGLIESCQPLPPGRTATKGFMRFVGTTDLAQTGAFDATADYVAKFGALVSGNVIGVRVSLVDQLTGAKTPGLYQFVTIS